jgi:thiamine kinase
MQLRELRSLADRWVPGSGPLDIRHLGSGLVNDTYRVSRDGVAYAFRLADPRSKDLGVDRAWELQVLHRAAGAGIAAPVECCDPGRGILVSHWVEGRCWNAATLRQPDNIGRIAELMRRIHRLPLPAPARVMTPASWIDLYRTCAPGRAHCALADDALALRAAANLAALEQFAPVVPVLCHSDLHCLNLIEKDIDATSPAGGPDYSLLLLDWEYAHASDPLWDLAGWIDNNDLEYEISKELATRYLGREPCAEECRRLQLLCWLYDYVCCLWSELYLKLHAAGPRVDSSANAVAARAERVSSRLSMSSK